MKTKLPFLFYFITMFAVPLAGAALFCIIFCLIQKNYYYLPYSLDFVVQLSYDAMYLFLFASLFFSVGVTVYTALFCRTGDFIGASITGLLSSMIIPIIMYLIRLMFLGSESSASTMEEYFYSDSLCAIENGARFLLALIIIIAVKLFYAKKKTEPVFQKPYLLPNSAVQLSLVIFYASWFIAAIISFLVSETHEVGSLLYEAALAVAGYFLSVLGAVLSESTVKGAFLRKKHP